MQLKAIEVSAVSAVSAVKQRMLQVMSGGDLMAGKHSCCQNR